MKRILLFALGMLLLATACDNKTKKNENEPAPAEPKQQPVETVAVMGQSQDYYLWNDEKPAIKGEIKDGSVWLTFDKEQVVYQTTNDEETPVPIWGGSRQYGHCLCRM